MDTRKENSQTQNDKHEEKVTRVLIIGAGYAGLTLANSLLQFNNKKKKSAIGTSSSSSCRTVQFNIVDRLHPPRPSMLVGSNRVPSADKILQELLLEPLSNHRDNVNDNMREYVPQEDLLRRLRSKVVVQYLHQVTSLQEVHDSNTILATIQLKDNGNASHVYVKAYDWVVAADGIRSQFASTKMSRILVIGDARHGLISDRLGRRRILEGANGAMEDAMALAHAMIMQEFSDSILSLDNLQPFRPRPFLWYRWWFWAVMVALLSWMFAT